MNKQCRASHDVCRVCQCSKYRYDRLISPVNAALDPGNKLFCDWFQANESKGKSLVVDVGGRDGQTSKFLAERFPDLCFDVRDNSQSLLDKGQQTLCPELTARIKFTQRSSLFDPQPLEDNEKVFVYILRNVLWNLPDQDCIKVLRSFMAVFEKTGRTVLLINELLSPEPGTFPPHAEIAYRRRDVTLMTMHNVKPRTLADWRSLFARASPHFKVGLIANERLLDDKS